MKRILLIICIFLCFMQYDFCFAQEQTITSYQNKKYSHLDISLNGKVKVLRQISYNPNKLCDTIPYDIDTIRPLYIQGIGIQRLCFSDTSVYFFDANLLPEKINEIHTYIDHLNKLYREETIYDFENGYLLSENRINISKFWTEDIIKYKYDSQGKLISKQIYDNSILYYEEFFEYDNRNRLIQKKEYARSIKPTCIETYRYDTIGNLTKKTSTNSNFINIYVYDHKGNKIEEGHCESKNVKKCKYIPTK